MTRQYTPTCMISNKNTISGTQRHEDRAPGSRGQSRSPKRTKKRGKRGGKRTTGWRRQSRSPKRTKKRGKRGGKRTSGRGGLRRNMTKSERLSRKYFIICSWNCASASRRGAGLARLAYDFDVLCLQETRTRPEKPLERNDFLVVQKHGGRGMAIVFRKDLQNTVSTVDRSQWCNNSRELQGMFIYKSQNSSKTRNEKSTQTDSGTSMTMRHSCQKPWEGTDDNGQQAKRIPISGISFKKTVTIYLCL